MSIARIKQELQDTNTNIDNTMEELNDIRKDITNLTKPFIQEQFKSLIKDAVIQKAEITTYLGSAKLTLMKQDLQTLLDTSNSIVDSVLSDNDYWIYTGYRTTSENGSFEQTNNNSQKAKKSIYEAIRCILGNLGIILIKYGYEYSTTQDGTWCKSNDSNAITYSEYAPLSLPTDLAKKLDDYSRDISKLDMLTHQIYTLNKLLTQEEAIELWNNA